MPGYLRNIILLLALSIFCACGTGTRIHPGLFETVASWQYPLYRQYSSSQECVGMGVSLRLNPDSTYIYSTMQMNAKGKWSADRRRITLHCDSLELKSELPLEEYFDKNLWVCPTEPAEFTLRNKILYRSYTSHEGVRTIMILERVPQPDYAMVGR